MRKLFLFLTAALVSTGMWAKTNVGDYSTQVISTDGTTSTWTFITPGSQVTIPTSPAETEDNDIIFHPGGGSKMKFSSSNGFSWSGNSDGYIYVPAGAAGTISMTVKSASDSRWLQLYVGGVDQGSSKRLWSKEANPATDARGPRSFSFTASDLTTKGGKTYLHFKDNNTELKIATFTVTLTTGTYNESTDPECPDGLTILGTNKYYESQTISLTANLTEGNGDISYQWYKGGIADDKKLTGKTSETLSIADCVIADGGDYYCVATKAECDSAKSSAYSVTVTEDPRGTIEDLVTISSDYSFTPSEKFEDTYMYEDKKLISLGGSGYSKGLQLKNSRQVAFKVAANAIISVTFTESGERKLQLGTTSAGSDLAETASSPANAFRSEAGIVYLSASNDLYFTKLDITFCESPAQALSLTSNAAATVYVGDEITFSTTGGNGGTITLTGANSEEINDSVWVATVGEHTFTASQPKTGGYCSQEAELVISVLAKTPVSEVIVTGEASAYIGNVVTYTATAENATEYEWYLDGVKQGSDSTKFIYTANVRGEHSIVCKARNEFNEENEWIASTAKVVTVNKPGAVTDTYIWKKGSDYTGCVDNPDVNPNATKNNTDLTYSTATTTGMTAMGRAGQDNTESTIVIAAKEDLYIQSICTYGKLEEPVGAQISWDGGSNWADLAKYSEGQKTFTAPNGTQPSSFTLRFMGVSKDSGGLWWRNALVTMAQKEYAVTFAAPSNGSLSIKEGNTPIESGATFVKGTQLTVIAEPDAQYILSTLTANGADIKETKSFTIGTAAVAVAASYSPATALDNAEDEVKAVKFLENGQLFIRRGEKVYTITGELVK